MGTITFEKYNGGVVPKTRFFAKNTSAVTTQNEVTVSFTSVNSTEMYANEGVVSSTTVKPRSVEIYIDDDSTLVGDPESAASNGVQRLAKITYDSTKVNDSAYDIYINPINKLDTESTLSGQSVKFNRTNTTGTKYFRIVVVAE